MAGTFLDLEPSGPVQQRAVQVSAGAPDAGRVVAANDDGKVDDSLWRDLDVDKDSVRQTTREMTPVSTSVTGPLTDHVLVAAGADRIRVLKNAGHCDPATGAGVYPVVTVKLGALTIFNDKLEAGLPWAETVCFEGEVGEDLMISLTTSETVYLNMRYEIFT